jgi:dTDP-4-dehydrorhamnose reductase
MFVTGGSGFLGRHLLNAASEGKWQIFAPPSNQLDVSQAESVMDEIRLWKPAAVVHLAYRKADPHSIVIASANVAAAATAVGARLVHLSSAAGPVRTSRQMRDRPSPTTANGSPPPKTRC